MQSFLTYGENSVSGVSVVCRFVKQDQGVIVRLEATGVICMESFKEFPQLARFTLRDEGW